MAINDKFIIGQQVTVRGRIGTIMECADKYKVKFTNGEFAFYLDREITHAAEPIALKGTGGNYCRICRRYPPEQGSDVCRECQRKIDRGEAE